METKARRHPAQGGLSRSRREEQGAENGMGTPMVPRNGDRAFMLPNSPLLDHSPGNNNYTQVPLNVSGSGPAFYMYYLVSFIQ